MPTPIERLFLVLRLAHDFVFRPKNSKEQELMHLSRFATQLENCTLNQHAKLMIYAMDIEPEIQPNIYGYDSHLHDILFSYFIKQDSDFLKSWKKEMQETNSWIDMQWFDDISKQIHLLLEQMEENQKADLITLLIRTSEYKFTNKLLFSVSDEYAIQIYLPPASEVPYNRQPPIVRRILLLRQQLETRMEVCIEELYEQLYLEVVLEQERLMREI